MKALVNTGKNAHVKVYSYTRFSTKEQRKGRGKARQDAGALKWCEENGHVLETANTFNDLGVSAFKGKNAAVGDLRRFLALVEDEQIEPGSILLIESLDRLSRNDINIAVQLLLQVINAGFVVVTLIDKAVCRPQPVWTSAEPICKRDWRRDVGDRTRRK